MVSDQSAKQGRWSAYQWGVICLLLLGLILSAVDRVNISVVTPFWIKNHILTATQAGLLQSIFGWGITFFLLFAGPLVDRFHPRVILPVGVFIWSIATWIGGLTTSFVALAFSRGLLGLGESTLLPSAPRLVVENIEAKDRSKAISIYFSGNKLGPTIGIPLASSLLLAYGWHSVFYVTGALGLLWLVLWFSIYRHKKGIVDPSSQPVNQRSTRISWIKLFAYRSTWALIFGQFGYLYVLYVFLTWLPGYLVLQHHLSIMKSGFLGTLPFIISIVTTLLGGWLSDRWIASTGNRTLVRKSLIGGGMFLSTVFIICAAFIQATVPAILFLSLTMATMGLITGSVNALPMDLAPKEIVSSLSSLQNFGGNLGASFAPLVTGILYHATNSFELPLLLTGGIALVFGACSYVFLLGEVEQSYNGISLQPKEASFNL